MHTLSQKSTRRRPNKTGSRTAPPTFLTDSQWVLIEDLFANPAPSPAGGRPRVDPRACLEGVLWILHSGAQWKLLPDWYPSPATCWRRLKEWTESGVLLEAWKRLLEHLDRRQLVKWEQAMGDGTFSPAKKGAPRWARPNGARDRRSNCSWTVVVCPSPASSHRPAMPK